jgi:hypothetical protein
LELNAKAPKAEAEAQKAKEEAAAQAGQKWDNDGMRM